MKTHETFKKKFGHLSVLYVTNDFLIFTLSKTVKYVLQWWMKKVWPEFCPFRTYLRMQHNISDIFERFSITSCDKKWRRRKPSRKFPAIWVCHVWQTISLYLLFWRQSNMYFSVHFFLALGLTEWFSDSRDERNSACSKPFKKAMKRQNFCCINFSPVLTTYLRESNN